MGSASDCWEVRSSNLGIPPLLKHACGQDDWLLCWHYTQTKVSHQRWISGNVYHIGLCKVRMRQNPLWLWNPEETSPEVQNRVSVAPQIDMCPTKIKQKALCQSHSSFSHLIQNYQICQIHQIPRTLQQQNKLFQVGLNLWLKLWEGNIFVEICPSVILSSTVGRGRVGYYHCARKKHMRDRIFKVSPIHVSVVYQIP